VLEVTFNAFTTERVFRLGQNDRADDLIAGNLRSQKHFPVRKLSVGEFHELTAWTHNFPFILHTCPKRSVTQAAVEEAQALPRSSTSERVIDNQQDYRADNRYEETVQV
jgi:hypothetical protein